MIIGVFDTDKESESIENQQNKIKFVLEWHVQMYCKIVENRSNNAYCFHITKNYITKPYNKKLWIKQLQQKRIIKIKNRLIHFVRVLQYNSLKVTQMISVSFEF